MAHESFEDEVVAQIMNANYICIKVDKEERPDLDAIYMNACQLMTGGGGWPLNLWLTPDQIPVYAGTYFPKENVYGRTGFTTVLTQLTKMWTTDQKSLLDKSQEIMAFLKRQSQSKEGTMEAFTVEQGIRDLEAAFDDVYGGFSKAPKFPSPHQLSLLMTYYEHKPEEKHLKMITKTLDAMYQGGIYDHVGGGFSRYSVDDKWLVPHFEKMLYDNALLLGVYTKAYQLTHESLYREVAHLIVAFLHRELWQEGGGFYTALDADSEGEEGKYYVWTSEEIDQVLGDESHDYKEAYDISNEGNFEGSNIPNRIGKNPSYGILATYKASNKKLWKAREERVRPERDDKVLTSMNGLVIASLCLANRVFEDIHCLQLATTTYDFINKVMIGEDGRLRGSYAKGIRKESVVLDDYAFYIEGLIELYQSTFDQVYLDEAIRLQKIVDDEFLDKDQGGYYLTSGLQENLIQRPKECYDGAIPSGNSVMALNLLKLSRLTDDLTYQDTFDQLLKTFASKVKKGPSYFAYLLKSVYHRVEGTKDLVIAVPSESHKSDVISGLHQSEASFFTIDIRVNRSDKKPIDGKVTYYSCEDFVCSKPTFQL